MSTRLMLCLNLSYKIRKVRSGKVRHSVRNLDFRQLRDQAALNASLEMVCYRFDGNIYMANEWLFHLDFWVDFVMIDAAPHKSSELFREPAPEYPMIQQRPYESRVNVLAILISSCRCIEACITLLYFVHVRLQEGVQIIFRSVNVFFSIKWALNVQVDIPNFKTQRRLNTWSRSAN